MRLHFSVRHNVVSVDVFVIALGAYAGVRCRILSVQANNGAVRLFRQERNRFQEAMAGSGDDGRNDVETGIDVRYGGEYVERV